MSDHPEFSKAVELLDSGDVTELSTLLKAHPELSAATDNGNATLLIRLIDWPGQRPNSALSAQALIDAGAEIDPRRDEQNGTPLSGALCTEEVELVKVLLDAGADINAPCGWQEGTVLQQADRLAENYLRANDVKLRELTQLFANAANRTVPMQTPMGHPIPLLFVSDFEAGLSFYTKKLGFKIAWLQDGNPSDPYGSIVRGNTDFHITVCKCDENVHVGRLFARIPVGDVDSLFEQCAQNGVNVSVEPIDRPWGMREFTVEDPDGNRFEFFQFIS